MVPLKVTTVRIPIDLRKQIEEYMKLRGHGKLTEATRALIRIGLEAEMSES
ncbi:MAG: hypothetical protein ACFFDT_24070 [Candidatus Hodarchaeota archaeon]